MEYYAIDQEFPFTLYVAEDSAMPVIRVSGNRTAVLNFQAKHCLFDKRSMFELADFIRNVAENMETYDEQDPPF